MRNSQTRIGCGEKAGLMVFGHMVKPTSLIVKHTALSVPICF